MTSRPIVRRKTSSQTQFLPNFSRNTPPTSYRDPTPTSTTSQSPPFPFPLPTPSSTAFSTDYSDTISLNDAPSPSQHPAYPHHAGYGMGYGMNRDPSSTGSLRGGRRDTASIVNAAGGSNGQAGGGSSASGQQGQGQAMVNGPEGVGALVEKRTASWWYLRRAHDGNELWFHTIQISKTDIEVHLEAQLGVARWGSRSKHLFILGLSLSPLFDIPQGMDFVKTTLRVLDEWEAWTEGGAGKGMKNLFRGQKAGRRAGGGSGLGGTAGTGGGGVGSGSGSDYGQEGGGAWGESVLVFANLPFTPDYFQTVISLCEIIRQLYTRLGNLLGPNALTPTTTTTTMTTTARSPGIPGAGNSSPRSTSFGVSVGMGKNRTTSSMSVQPGVGIAGGGGNGGGSGRAGWYPGTGELIMKMDSRLKKILNMFAREMETIARKAVDEELASLLHGESRGSFGMGANAAGYGIPVE